MCAACGPIHKTCDTCHVLAHSSHGAFIIFIGGSPLFMSRPAPFPWHQLCIRFLRKENVNEQTQQPPCAGSSSRRRNLNAPTASNLNFIALTGLLLGLLLFGVGHRPRRRRLPVAAILVRTAGVPRVSGQCRFAAADTGRFRLG